jgi:hypothetical protein
MKNILFGFILLFALFVFGVNLGMMNNAQATPLFAQVPQPTASPQPPKAPETPQASAPTANQPTANQPTPQPATPPIAAKPKPPKEKSSGPYDMEAMKAFNRALYGS